MTRDQADDSAVPGFETTDHDGVLVVTVSGDIDMTNADQAREALETTLDTRPAGLVVDLAVQFIASSGLAVLVEISQRAQQEGIGFAVAASDRAARRPLVLTGMEQIFSLHESVPDAVEALRQAEPDTALGSS